MPGALPPLPQQDWDQHQSDKLEATTQEARSLIAGARSAQETADAAAEQDFTQRAQAQVQEALAPVRQAQESVSFTAQAQEQVRALTRSVPQVQPYAGDTGSAPPRSSDAPTGELQDYARAAAVKAGIDPETFVRQIQQESGFRTDARNPSGATGIAQIVPSAHPNVDPNDPHASLDYAANWMGQLTKQYGGDTAKALAAYNAGPGNVEKYGGVPPFEETQRYVKIILGDGGDALGADSPAPGGRNAPTGLQTPAGGVKVEALGQFEQGLPPEDAYSICGPVAALAFARANGRNPDLGEARRLAKQVGWTSAGGMNGVQNQQKLLTEMGVASRLDTNPDFGQIAADAEAGNPVIISTGVHYYFVNGYDKQTGQLHVGKTGEARKGGGSWMSAQQISSLDGGINGALFVDNPASPTPSVAASSGDSEGERPPSEFEPPPEGASVGGRWADAPATVRVPGTGLDQPQDVPAAVGAAADAGGDALVGMTQQANVDRATAAAHFKTIAQKLEAGEHVTQEEIDRGLALVESTAVGATEPVKVVGPLAGVAGKVAGAVGEAVTGAVTRSAALTADEVSRLRLDKFPEAVRDTIQTAATEGDFWRTQRRGVIPDDQAEKMADRLGRSVDQMIAGGKAGRSLNTEETRALRNAVTSQAMKVADLNGVIAKAPHDATGAQIAEAIGEGMKLSDLTRIAEGARAEAGRTFRAYQANPRDSVTNPGGAVERIFKAVGGAENASKAVLEYQKMVAEGADVFALANFWARKEAPPVGANDWYELVRRNSMLSGPRTILINLVSGGTEVPWKLATDAVMSTLAGHPGAIVPEARAVWAGLQRGLKPAMETIAKGITEEQALKGDVPRSISARVSNPIAKKVAGALEAPMTVAQATDEVMHSIGYSMHVANEAAQTASREGLKGAAWHTRVADLIETPTASTMTRADRAADDMTFKGEMGNLGRALNQVQKVPLIGPALIPFLRTVYHITARGIDRSPLGLVGTGIDVARGVYRGGKDLPKGVRPLAPRLTDNVLGTAASAWMYGQAMEGNISGAGPDDPEKVKMLEAQGWQRYAVNVGGRWVSYTNWGPLAIPLSLMAGAAEAQTYAKPGATGQDKVLDAFGRSAKVLTEQNYLQGIGAVYKAFNDPERFGQQWLTQYVQTLVPFGAAINTVGQATDDLIRQPAKGDVGEALAGRFPGLRQGLAAKQDVLGRDVRNEQRGLGAVVPLRSSEGRPDPTLQVLLENGADIGAPPKEVKSLPLTPADQQRHQEIAGGLVADTVGKITADPRFADLPRATRQKILQGAVERARTAAGGILFGELGSAELSRRYREKQGATR